MKRTRLVIAAGALLAVGGNVWVIAGALPDQDYPWLAAALCHLTGTLLAAAGMWRFKSWGLFLGLLLAALSLILGFYISHFRWAFWLWKEPTLKDRILSVTLQNPGGIFLIAFSFFWFIYFLNPATRKQFRGDSARKPGGMNESEV